MGIDADGRHSHPAAHHRNTAALPEPGVAEHVPDIRHQFRVFKISPGDEFCAQRIARHQHRVRKIALFPPVVRGRYPFSHPVSSLSCVEPASDAFRRVPIPIQISFRPVRSLPFRAASLTLPSQEIPSPRPGGSAPGSPRWPPGSADQCRAPPDCRARGPPAPDSPSPGKASPPAPGGSSPR